MTPISPISEINVASRVQRLDRGRECRFMLALLMLMGCATATVLATTREALSESSDIVLTFSSR